MHKTSAQQKDVIEALFAGQIDGADFPSVSVSKAYACLEAGVLSPKALQNVFGLKKSEAITEIDAKYDVVEEMRQTIADAFESVAELMDARGYMSEVVYVREGRLDADIISLIAREVAHKRYFEQWPNNVRNAVTSARAVRESEQTVNIIKPSMEMSR